MKESAPDDLSELSKDSHETSAKATHQKMSSHSPSIKLTRMIKTSSPPSKAARCEPTSRPERRIEKASASKAKLSQPDSHSRDGSMTWENGTNITKGEPVHTQGGVHKQRRTTPSGWVHLPVNNQVHMPVQGLPSTSASALQEDIKGGSPPSQPIRFCCIICLTTLYSGRNTQYLWVTKPFIL